MAWLSLGQVLSLMAPDQDIYIYYHVIKTFFPIAAIHYYLALISSLLTLLALYPLFAYAFHGKQRALWLFGPLFFIRFFADILGHNYEFLFLKSHFTNELTHGLIFLTFAILLILPSYYAHYKYISQK